MHPSLAMHPCSTSSPPSRCKNEFGQPINELALPKNAYTKPPRRQNKTPVAFPADRRVRTVSAVIGGENHMRSLLYVARGIVGPQQLFHHTRNRDKVPTGLDFAVARQLALVLGGFGKLKTPQDS